MGWFLRNRARAVGTMAGYCAGFASALFVAMTTREGNAGWWIFAIVCALGAVLGVARARMTADPLPGPSVQSPEARTNRVVSAVDFLRRLDHEAWPYSHKPGSPLWRGHVADEHLWKRHRDRAVRFVSTAMRGPVAKAFDKDSHWFDVIYPDIWMRFSQLGHELQKLAFTTNTDLDLRRGWDGSWPGSDAPADVDGKRNTGG